LSSVKLAVTTIAACLVLGAAPAGAITFGQIDGQGHPNVGAVVGELPIPGLYGLCAGTLVAPDIVLTAAHCTNPGGMGVLRMWVDFRPQISPDPSLLDFAGMSEVERWVAPPAFGMNGGGQDVNDVALLFLKSPVFGIEPAELPSPRLLNRLQESHELRSQVFTTVGYGYVLEQKRAAPHSVFLDGVRRWTTQEFLHLNKIWLGLSMNPVTGSGGGCHGDSGGPHFLGGPDSNLIVSLTVTGDAICRATDVTYRLDTPAVQRFLGNYLSLP
jgi:hypothetical protein